MSLHGGIQRLGRSNDGGMENMTQRKRCDTKRVQCVSACAKSLAQAGKHNERLLRKQNGKDGNHCKEENA